VTLYNVGNKVRILLDNPTSIQGKKLHGKFRSSDIRWTPKEYTIKAVMVQPNQPFMYETDYDHHLRTAEQLLPAKQPELYFAEEEQPVGKVDKDTFEVEKLLEKKTMNGKIHYLVKWRNYPKKDATYEPRSELIKTIPQMIKAYDKKKN
jgi:hypothetical protein